MIQHRRSGRGALAVGLSVVGLLGVSCASVGPTKLVSTHTAYNDAIQLTVTREVLSNIVRSRYADPMLFVGVSTINAQFSVSAGGSAGVAGGGGAGTTGEVGASVGYSDSPTITFVPQSDNAFYKSLYGLFEVSEAVGFALSYRFGQADPAWQALRLRFWFAAINGASDYARGESRALYDERLDALVRLLQHGAFFQQVPEWDADTTAFPKWKVFGEDMVAAFRMGMFFVEEDDGESVRLARHRLVLALVLPDPDDPEVAEALEDLGVTPGRSRYVFRPPTDAMPGESDPYAIWVSWTTSGPTPSSPTSGSGSGTTATGRPTSRAMGSAGTSRPTPNSPFSGDARRWALCWDQPWPVVLHRSGARSREENR